MLLERVQEGSSLLRVFIIFGYLTNAALSQDIFRWQKIDVTGLSPKPRKDVAIAFDTARNSLTVFGGRSGVEIFSDTWTIDLLSKNWTRVNDSLDGNGLLVPGENYGMAFGTDKDTLVVAFGRNAGATSTAKKIYKYNFSSRIWNSTDASFGNPTKRFQSKASVINGNLYTTHGHGDSDLLSDSYRLNLNSNGWEKIHNEINQYNPVLPHSRYGHGLAALPDNRLLVYGGCLRYVIFSTPFIT